MSTTPTRSGASYASPAARRLMRRGAPSPSREPAVVARRLLAQPHRWEPLVQYGADERYYRRVAVTAHYEAWLLTWTPGQSTGLHDHGGSAGAFAVARGTLREDVLAPGSRHLDGLVSHALGPRRVRAFGPHHVHAVANDSDAPAVSLHVYAPVLTGMRRFSVDDSGFLRVVSEEQAGVDW